MAEVRQAILRGTDAAARTHQDLGSRDQWNHSAGRIDVFGAIDHFGLPLMFQPMDGLLGAYLVRPSPGVLVSTQRPLSVRRYTAAHELGHYRLGHEASLDGEDMINRSPFHGGYDHQEVEADAFAIAFIVPVWFVSGVMQQRLWKKSDMADPANIYQLALRAGASYLATCYALRNHQVLDADTARAAIRQKPREIKKSILKALEPDSWWLDVWSLDERDNGTFLELAPNDVLDITLTEHSGGGYLWDVAGVSGADLELVDDRCEPLDNHRLVGAHVRRRIIAQAKSGGVGSVQLVERRPWEQLSPPLNSYHFAYDIQEANGPGLLPAQLERMVGGGE